LYLLGSSLVYPLITLKSLHFTKINYTNPKSPVAGRKRKARGTVRQKALFWALRKQLDAWMNCSHVMGVNGGLNGKPHFNAKT